MDHLTQNGSEPPIKLTTLFLPFFVFLKTTKIPSFYQASGRLALLGGATWGT